MSLPAMKDQVAILSPLEYTGVTLISAFLLHFLPFDRQDSVSLTIMHGVQSTQNLTHFHLKIFTHMTYSNSYREDLERN